MSDSPKIYVRVVDFPYDITIYQTVTTDREEAFNFIPEPDHAVDTEIHVWQNGERIEIWWWVGKSNSFVKQTM